MSRFASIDLGTNTALLLVADRDPAGRFHPVRERAAITRLGQGVDATGLLSAEAMERTLGTLEAYAREACALGAEALAVSATSAARDARNGADFLAAAHARAGVRVEVLSGDEEARLSFASARADFGREGAPLVMLDIGGGSTELAYGGGPTGGVSWRRSFDVGSVRLTERLVRADPPTPAERAAVQGALDAALAGALPPPPAGAPVVAVAGTPTSLLAVARGVEPYDSARVHGGWLSRGELAALVERLWALPLAARRALPGMPAGRADVLPVGALLLSTVLGLLGAEGCRVSDRGLRWGLLVERFGVAASAAGETR
jgi:exopolyphosphatase/guanosine-5'-triphosphate,3'-diphosphate pyrophosphatase